jgi:hypothetical protein
MFNLDVDDRLTAWLNLRNHINDSSDPLKDAVEFWSSTPFTAYNHHIDPYYPASWPTPWEMIVHNKYDDFTKAVMIGYTLLLTDRYKNSSVQIKTLVDTNLKRLYNIACVDDMWALNYDDGNVVPLSNIPSLYSLENLVELKRPR